MIIASYYEVYTMMVMIVAMRENAVLMTIQLLQSEGKDISYDAIGERLGCSYQTVYRAMSNLMASGLIKRVGTPRSGYTYEVLANAG